MPRPRGPIEFASAFSAWGIEWSKAVLERDGRVCQGCGGVATIAHHKVPWEADRSKRFDLSNGEALCTSCHAKRHVNDRLLAKRPKNPFLAEHNQLIADLSDS
jgi:5-methylcytosine-specific restriction endonuclease McrA